MASACVLALVGCSPMVPLQRAQVARITADASPSELQATLGKATEVRAFEFSFNAQSYRAREFRLQTGAQQQSSVVCTPTCVPIFYTVPVTQDYVLLWQPPAERLLAWGSLEELSKSADERVSALMPALKEARSKQIEASKK